MFVDELFVGQLLGRGLVYNRIGSGLVTRLRSDEMLSERLAAGFIEDPDPIRDLPADSKVWDSVRAILI